MQNCMQTNPDLSFKRSSVQAFKRSIVFFWV